MNPLVSVIIPTYNRQDLVGQAIKSALAQSFKNIEVIVIDDASNDKTSEVVLDLARQDARISLLYNEVNLGFVKTLNKAVAAAKGKYITRLDDDDVWIDEKKLEKQVNFMEKNPEYTLVGGGVVRVNSSGQEVVRYLLPQADQEIRKVILVDNVFSHSAVLFKKEHFVASGGYDEQFGFFSDWALWLELGKMGKFHNFQEFFVNYLDQELSLGASARDYEIRRKLLAKFNLHNKYKPYYAGSKKALMLSLASYAYSFIPFRKQLWPIIFWIRKLLFGTPPYQYIKK